MEYSFAVMWGPVRVLFFTLAAFVRWRFFGAQWWSLCIVLKYLDGLAAENIEFAWDDH